MTSKERINSAMQLKTADRVPVMCQLSLGHYFIHSGLKPVDIWYSSEGFAEALVRLQKKYNFDGILVNLPGRDPDYERFIDKIIPGDNEVRINWKNGSFSVFPLNDNPHFYPEDGVKAYPVFEDINPEDLFYIEPWDITEINYPFTWGFDESPRPFYDYFPEYHSLTIKKVLEASQGKVSVHSEVFSPWSQLLELLNYENALMAMLLDPEKVKACLERLSMGAIELGKKQAALGVDAVLISSAFAGAGFISRDQYSEFIAPFERKVIEGIKKEFDIPVYTHTCGKIGDRLDLMMGSGTNGIDTLDPPPIGTVDLQEAKRLLSGKAFIKGNIDPINTLLNGTREDIIKDVTWRIKTGMTGGGYILSSACSVAPHTPPENIELLSQLAEENGKY